MEKSLKSKILLYSISFIILIVILFPLWIVFVSIFKSNIEITENALALPNDFTLKYFVEALEKMEFFSSMISSLFITVTSVVALTIFPAALAWQLARNKTTTSKIIFSILITAMLVPFQAIMLPLVVVTDRAFMNNMYVIWFVYLGFGAPLATFMFHGYFSSVPIEMEQAASIDGCNPFQTFMKVVLPILQPIVVTIAVLNVMWIWNDYLLPKMVLSDGTMTLPMSIQKFNQGIYGKQYNYMMSGIFAMIIPAMLFYAVTQKYIIEGITAGSVK